MSAPFKDATNDAVQFLTKHGDLTRAAAYDAIRLLTGNGFVVTQTDMLPSATDLSQAAVAAALEAAAGEAQMHADHWRKAWETAKSNSSPKEARDWQTMMLGGLFVKDSIRALITKPQHDALAAHVAAEVAKARADQAWDAALVEAAKIAELIAAGDVMANALRGHYIVPGSAGAWQKAVDAMQIGAKP